MDLKTRIQKILKEKGTPSKQLEQDLGFGDGYVSKLNQSSPNANNLLAIANYLNVSLDYLMTGKEPDYSDESARLVVKIRKDNELNKALQKYFELSDAKKKHVIELINLLGEK